MTKSVLLSPKKCVPIYVHDHKTILLFFFEFPIRILILFRRRQNILCIHGHLNIFHKTDFNQKKI